MVDDTFIARMDASAKIGKVRAALEIIPQVRASRLCALATLDELERALAQEWAKMTGVDTVTWDERNFRRLKVAYAHAKMQGHTQFTFEGHEYLVVYAKYLIEYLEDKFRREG